MPSPEQDPKHRFRCVCGNTGERRKRKSFHFQLQKGDPQVPVQTQPLRFQRSDLDVCTLTPFSVVRGPGCGQIGGGGRLFGMLVVNMGWLGSVSYSVWK